MGAMPFGTGNEEHRSHGTLLQSGTLHAAHRPPSTRAKLG